MHIKHSVVWNITTEELQTLIDTSVSMSDVCRKLGLNPENGAIRSLYRRISIEGINTAILKKNRHEYKINTGFQKKLNFINIFVEHSTATRSTIRKNIIKYKILEYKCNKCGNNGEWCGEPISLQLEHINGVNDDHRIENLCWLCPNCHSQTSTFAGRNIKKSTITKSKRPRLSKFNVTKDELEQLMANNTMVAIGKMFGVSDNAIRKRCKKYGII